MKKFRAREETSMKGTELRELWIDAALRLNDLGRENGWELKGLQVVTPYPKGSTEVTVMARLRRPDIDKRRR